MFKPHTEAWQMTFSTGSLSKSKKMGLGCATQKR